MMRKNGKRAINGGNKIKKADFPPHPIIAEEERVQIYTRLSGFGIWDYAPFLCPYL